MQPIDITIESNDKYRAVIDGDVGGDVPETEAEYTEKAEYAEAAEAYIEVVSDTDSHVDEAGIDGERLPTLAWDMLSVSKDPDLVAKMATYFGGMTPDEPTDVLRSKLRLLPVETYATVQVAARAELRD